MHTRSIALLLIASTLLAPMAFSAEAGRGVPEVTAQQRITAVVASYLPSFNTKTASVFPLILQRTRPPQTTPSCCESSGGRAAMVSRLAATPAKQ